MTAMTCVLMTGAAGGIGTALREELRGAYPVLRLSDIAEMAPARDGEEVMTAALEDADAAARMVDGVDGILHFGGISVEHPWEPILQSNIIGLYNLYMAAADAGVKRIVFASSNHVIGFHRRGRQLSEADRARPDSRYGLSKGFGELAGQYFADKYGIGVLSVRIGSCFEKPTNARFLSTWMSRRDMAQLCRVGLETPVLNHEVVWGVSANDRGWWDNSRAFQLGYTPQDNAEDFAPEVMAPEVPEDADPLALQLQGGTFGSAEYRGDPNRVLKGIVG